MILVSGCYLNGKPFYFYTNKDSMASNSETGHGINVNNAKVLADFCASLGVGYNPSNPDLKVTAQLAQWTLADTAHQALLTAIQATKIPINNREIVFEPTEVLVTRTLNFYKSTKASAQSKADAKGYADRFRGTNVKIKKGEDGTADPDSISNSHMGFVQRHESFKQLVELYKSDPNYAPNEADLKTTALTTIAANMKTANDGMGAIIAPMQVARITRDKALYTPLTGILDVAQMVRDYVKGLYKAKAPEAKMVNAIKFRRPKKK